MSLRKLAGRENGGVKSIWRLKEIYKPISPIEKWLSYCRETNVLKSLAPSSECGSKYRINAETLVKGGDYWYWYFAVVDERRRFVWLASGIHRAAFGRAYVSAPEICQCTVRSPTILNGRELAK